MYLDEDKVHRFLVADEVGLGKTLVARGLIAKVIDHLGMMTGVSISFTFAPMRRLLVRISPD